jgi:hypothetical protein
MEPRAKTLLWLVVLAAVSTSPLHSEPLDHRASFELGKLYARRMHKTWGWYLYGLASIPVAGWTANLDLPEAPVPRGETLAGISTQSSLGFSSANLAMVAWSAPCVAATLIRPTPVVEPGEENVEPASFRAGYVHEARRKSLRSIHYGWLTLMAGALVGIGFLSALD